MPYLIVFINHIERPSSLNEKMLNFFKKIKNFSKKMSIS